MNIFILFYLWTVFVLGILLYGALTSGVFAVERAHSVSHIIFSHLAFLLLFFFLLYYYFSYNFIFRELCRRKAPPTTTARI